MIKRNIDLWKILVPTMLTMLGTTWYLATTIQKNTDLGVRNHDDYESLKADSEDIKRRVTNIERTQRDMEMNQTYMIDTDYLKKLRHGK